MGGGVVIHNSEYRSFSQSLPPSLPLYSFLLLLPSPFLQFLLPSTENGRVRWPVTHGNPTTTNTAPLSLHSRDIGTVADPLCGHRWRDDTRWYLGHTRSMRRLWDQISSWACLGQTWPRGCWFQNNIKTMKKKWKSIKSCFVHIRDMVLALVLSLTCPLLLKHTGDTVLQPHLSCPLNGAHMGYKCNRENIQNMAEKKLQIWQKGLQLWQEITTVRKNCNNDRKN